MPGKIYLIVEGHSEETSAPVLVRHLLHAYHGERGVTQPVGTAFNAHGRFNLLPSKKSDGRLKDFLNLLRKKADCVGVLVLFDVEKQSGSDGPQCAVNLAYQSATIARTLALPFPVAVVCAVCEFESWFLYDMSVLTGFIDEGVTYGGDPEKECSAKEWIKHNGRGKQKYSESTDQVKIVTRLQDDHLLLLEQRSRSFRRLVAAVGELLDAIVAGQADVTPAPATPPPME